MKILVVDDDPQLRRLVRNILGRAGHEIVEAPNGAASWELIQREPSPVLITEWMMPDVSGPELIRRVRSAGIPQRIYIIVLSARESEADVIEALNAGADDYLIKPFRLSELRARVAIGGRILAREAQFTEAQARLEKLATRDDLTGLLNRGAIQDRAERELSRVRRGQGPLSLMLVDIDHFKAINDRYGHQVGDRALQSVANTLSQQTRHYDLVGRWGGEEFLVVLPQTTSAKARAVAERLRLAIAGTSLTLGNGQPLALQASLGVATSTTGSQASFHDLVRRAGVALYQAKRTGRNRVCQSEAVSNSADYPAWLVPIGA